MIDEKIYYLETTPTLYLFISDHLPFNENTLKKIKEKIKKKVIVLPKEDLPIMKHLLERDIVDSGIYNLI
ncbi:MAG: hypothetical protein C0169_02090 [Thermodesulfobacterium geofontis]|uniref:Uncharacterized protein n=1 Tax=Thermodesulfobacterium geofontis TaxID=1295609 RepID=A0A2N7QFR0_9BACT|nr:MAG: hypothetical protein C0169_02090 [Thermodesulfobacterium geofontis]